MGDPIVLKNAKRVLAEHRIDDIHYGKPVANIACTCGWRMEWESRGPGEMEDAWNTHKRDVGEKAHT
jgi:hypothetical protein